MEPLIIEDQQGWSSTLVHTAASSGDTIHKVIYLNPYSIPYYKGNSHIYRKLNFENLNSVTDKTVTWIDLNDKKAPFSQLPNEDLLEEGLHETYEHDRVRLAFSDLTSFPRNGFLGC